MSIQKELSFVLPNRAGTLGKVASALAAKGINLLAIDASGGLEYNIVRIVADRPDQALPILKQHKLEVGVGSVVWLPVADKAGSLARITRRLGEAGINIDYLYATGGHGEKVVIVLHTADNRRAQKVLRGAS